MKLPLYRLRRNLLAWFEANARPLPWRETRDPYSIWVSEIMLQQTRVAAVIPYYQRFLERYPDPAALAAAPEQELLAMWAGLGYYSRARNLQKAARAMGGAFPESHEAILELPGVGVYTAAAVASIAFGLPHAAVDGNVLRVIARLTNDASNVSNTAVKKRFEQIAGELLDRANPGAFNQAMMELGATVCLPRTPLCGQCPVAAMCEGKAAGRQNELPVKLRKMEMVKRERTVLVIRERGRILLWQRSADSAKLAGFWELPEPELLPHAEEVEHLGSFKHSITNHNYVFQVMRGKVRRAPPPFEWIGEARLNELPLSTTARKALAVSSH